MTSTKGRSTKEIFEQYLPEKLKTHADLLADTGIHNKTVIIDIDGEQGGRWGFRLDEKGLLSMVPGSSTADTTISAKDETFQGLLEGRVNVMTAVLFGKIKISGDKGLAAQIGSSLKKIFA